MHHCEPRQKELGILKLHDLYKLQMNCLTFDCLRGDSPKWFADLFIRKGDATATVTRSQTDKPFDIQLKEPIMNPGPVLKSSFPLKAPEFWNQLPNNLKNCSSKKEFRSKAKKHLLDSYNNIILCSNPLCSDIEYFRHVDCQANPHT